jgi:hypothetical protein
MARQELADYTQIETLLKLQGQSISANGSSVTDQTNTQSPSQGSFRFLPPGSALKSTQQLPLDWSDFSRHTFFSSAVANVNVAFDNIINTFPFDGTFKEIEDFFDSLTGFEAYVFNCFPKSLNSLTFKNNAYIEVIDAAGSKFPELSRNTTGASVLDPEASSLSFQFKIKVPETTNENQVITQRIVSNTGYTLALSQSLSISSSNLIFCYVSGSTFLTSSVDIEKGSWQDVAAIFNRRPGVNRLQLFISGALVNSSNSISELSVFTSTTSPLYIATGSSQAITGFEFTPKQTLSASLDDFKVFVGTRTNDEIKYAANNPVEPSALLRLHYKFNEPSGSYDRNSFVIDASGNGLHSTITNFNYLLRNSQNETGGPASFSERSQYNPVLFPDYPDLSTLNSDLLNEASDYDANNPNMIMKLIPSHYLEEEQSEMGLQTVDGDIGRSFSEGGDLPRATSLGSVQLITSMLLIWAKQFDELKMFIDQFSKVDSTSYQSSGSIADSFLPFLAKQYGIELPRMFSNPSYLQYLHGDNLTADYEIGVNPLYKLEADIWRRILVNLPHLIKSKGTIDSVKSIIRSVGIDPDVTLRFKEFGGARSGYILGRQMLKRSVNFTSSGSFLITSPFLSASRNEPGFPTISSGSSDCLLTSGSFTFETYFRKAKSNSVIENQSIVRFLTTGSYGEGLLLNLIIQQSGALPGSQANIVLSGAYSSNILLKKDFSISLKNLPIFDGIPCYISFGREKNSDVSDWYLRFGKTIGNNFIFNEDTSSVGINTGSYDCFSTITSSYNASGTFFQIGTSTAIPDGPANIFLNSTACSDIAKLTSFNSQISQIRFWSKHLSENEWKEHAKNPFSLGVSNPAVNFNFNTEDSGSFERIRIDAGLMQEITASNVSGEISIYDFSQNNFHLSGTNFEPNETVITPIEMFYNPINPYFDESADNMKVRIRSWENSENVDLYGGVDQPIYQVDPSESPIDDNRFGIEISAVRALNEDILLMFGGHEAVDDVFGNPADAFSTDYSSQGFLRDIYFNRLTEPLSFKNVMLFSKWFESNIERLIEQVIPFNTDFLGINFVIENHVLERNKIRYGWGDNYLGTNDRNDDETYSNEHALP